MVAELTWYPASSAEGAEKCEMPQIQNISTAGTNQPWMKQPDKLLREQRSQGEQLTSLRDHLPPQRRTPQRNEAEPRGRSCSSHSGAPVKSCQHTCLDLLCSARMEVTTKTSLSSSQRTARRGTRGRARGDSRGPRPHPWWWMGSRWKASTWVGKRTTLCARLCMGLELASWRTSQLRAGLKLRDKWVWGTTCTWSEEWSQSS